MEKMCATCKYFEDEDCKNPIGQNPFIRGGARRDMPTSEKLVSLGWQPKDE